MTEAVPHWWLVIGSLRSGGTERQVVALANSLAARGVAVSIAVIDERPVPAYRIDSAVTVIGLGRGGVIGYLQAMLRLASLVRDGDVVYAFLDAAMLLARIASARRSVRLLGGVRDSNLARSGRSIVVFHLARLLGRRMDAMIGNADACIEFYRRRGFRPRKTAVVGNGIDCDTWMPDPRARAAVRQELGVDAHAVLIGFVARTDRKKRHDLLLDAFAQLHDDVHLVLIGRGTDTSREIQGRVEELRVASRVWRLGERSDVPRLTAALDVACCISDFEGFPNSLLEAMACGVCCVATDVGGVREVVADAGVIVAGGVPEELSTALAALVADRERRERLGAAGRRRAIEKFSIEAMTDATVRAAGM